MKQFVPSEICLKCDGCCRFELADSPWRPKTGQEECIEKIDAAGYVKSIVQDKHQQCSYFNKSDNTCAVYTKRPFECAFYPFIVSKETSGIKVYMHLACPYIQEKETSLELEVYVAYLKDYLSQSQTKDFLKKNDRLLHDYSDFAPELKFLFTIEV